MPATSTPTPCLDPALIPLSVQPEVEARRFKTAAEAQASWVGKQVPEEDLQRLIAYAQTFALDFSASASDFRPMEADGAGWIAVLNWSGVRRLCRFSGRWRPGKADYRTLGGQDFAYASCYTRDTLTSTEWYEVSAHAKLSTSMLRDSGTLNQDDLKAVRTSQEWELTPEVELDKAAQYNAAVKALGSVITDHQSDYSVPPVLYHADLIYLRSKAGRTATARG